MALNNNMIKEIIEKIELEKPKSDKIANVAKGELGVKGNKPIIKKD